MKNIRINPIWFVACAFNLLVLSACANPHFDEPGIRGKIVDGETQQPLAGVVVFGYYATVEGSFGGGEKLQDVVRVFEVETDASGIFEIPAWSSVNQKISGEARTQFPAMGMFKGGYKTMNKRMGSLRWWAPQNMSPQSHYTPDGNVRDWTAFPHAMSAVKTEKERYTALIDLRDSTGYKGECGWEQHAALLWAQHNEWKGWLKRNIPAEGLDSAGYKLPTYAHPDRLLSLSNKSSVDGLLEAYASQPAKWKCADPNVVFSRNSYK